MIPSNLFLPPLLPDESVFGYLQRLAILSNGGALKPLVRSLLGIKLVQAPWLLPSHLEPLAEKLGTVVTSGNHLLSNHTIFPALRPFLDTASQRVLRTRMLGHATSMGGYFRVGLVHARAERPGSRQAYCPDCVAGDERTYGLAYWRRTHQFPYVVTCGVHGTQLRVGSGCCARSERTSAYASLPGRMCACAVPELLLGDGLPSQALMLDARISRLLVRSLTFAWPDTVNRTNIGRAYRIAFESTGCSKGAYMSNARAVDDFVGRMDESLLAHYGCTPRTDSGWFVDAVRGIAPASVIKNALLIHHLFGDLDAVVKAVCQLPAMSAGDGPRGGALPNLERIPRPVSIPGTPEFDARRDEFRARLQAWIATCALPSRTNAQRDLGYVPMWLREFDEEWYDATLPSAQNRHTAQRSTAYWEMRRHQADDDGIVHVRRRLAELTHPEVRPVRLTKAKLLDGLRNRQAPRPRTLELIAKVVESTETYKERLVLWIVQHPEAIPEVRGGALQYAYMCTHVPKTRIRELLADAQARPVTTFERNERGTITFGRAEIVAPCEALP